jgi:hypothetical protein
MLKLCYHYRHLNNNDLSNLPFTDLITHKVRLKPNTRPYNKRHQKRWSPVKEAWLRKLILQNIEGGIYESTVSANGELSNWNAQAVLVNKVKNPDPNNEPRLTFNYRNVHKDMPECALILASKVHNYLSDPRHEYFLSANIKHGYFAIKTHPADKYVFAFYIDGIGQLQPTRMPQGSQSAGFTFGKLINIAFKPIPPPNPKPSLFYSHFQNDEDPSGIITYADNIFERHPTFESVYYSLRDHLFPRVNFAQLRFAFKKLSIAVDHVRALGVDHIIEKKIKIVKDRIRRIVT